jgi:hypothetical protein
MNKEFIVEVYVSLYYWGKKTESHVLFKWKSMQQIKSVVFY